MSCDALFRWKSKEPPTQGDGNAMRQKYELAPALRRNIHYPKKNLETLFISRNLIMGFKMTDLIIINSNLANKSVSVPDQLINYPRVTLSRFNQGGTSPGND